jgi:hypothetical protein
VPLEFVDASAPDGSHEYRVIAINTVGLASPPSGPVSTAASSR